MNNNDWMLATTHCGNIVVNELHETDSKFISLAETISPSLLAIALNTSNVASLNLFIPKNIA
jgi:hypothetical protein